MILSEGLESVHFKMADTANLHLETQMYYKSVIFIGTDLKLAVVI